MNVTDTPLAGVKLITPAVHRDERGFFLETYRETRYREAGVAAPFVQDNHSRSTRDVLRGLHLQVSRPQGKLVRVARGRIWDVAVDVDPRSPTFRQHYAAVLCDDAHAQLYVPPGFAHGFVVLSEVADVIYRCTAYYDPADEATIRWDDPELAIPWPVASPVLSARDRGAPSLAAFLEARRP